MPPLLDLHGLSSGDFVPALGQFPGSAAGLSAPVITRLTETWKAEQRIFAARDLPGVDHDCIVDNSLRMWTTEGPRPG